MLKLNNIVKNYAAGDSTVAALRGVSVAFRDCEFVSILGPSGCGKTTMLNIIGGLDRYSSGDLIINGRSTKEYKDSDWDTYRNHSIGFVFQSYNLIPHQSVLANVELALTLSGIGKAERRRRATAALEKVGLGDQLHKRPNQMSGGQMQRVAIARALVNDPEILLADEPTGALDSTTSVQVMDILKDVARDRLVIMVTHNKELAEEYSTRIVSLLDGQIVGDTDPFDDSGIVKEKDASREKKLNSMSHLTAWSLSFNNLLSKRTRTLLTSFAGSIGIIGIALILAMSTGINAYIDGIQRDTLSSYPITLESEHADLSTMMAAMGAGSSDDIGRSEPHELDAVYSSAMLYDMMNSMFNIELNDNNLSAFRDFLEKKLAEEGEESASEYISSVQYSYDVSLNTYVHNIEDKYVNTNLTDAFMAMSGGESGMSNMEGMYGSMSSQFTNFSLWDEILPASDGALVSDILYEQYDLLHGKWPEAADEVVLIVNSFNEISDLAFYSLGLVTQQEISDILAAVMKQETIEFDTHRIDYEDACNITFKLLTDSDYYTDNDGDGVFEYIGDDEDLLDMVLRNAYEVKIVGVIRPNEDAVATIMNGSFGYTRALTEYVIEHTAESAVYAAQSDPKNENFDVFTGLPFIITEALDPTDSFKADEIMAYFESLSDEEKTGLYIKMLSEMPEDEINAAVDQYMANYDTRAKMEDMISASYGSDPDAIKEYLKSYDDDELEEMIRESMAEMVRQGAKTTAEQQVQAIMNTPSDEELKAITATVTAQLTTREAKLYYVMNDWSKSTTMNAITLSGYLTALSDGDLDKAVQAVAAKTAGEMYAAMSSDSAAGYAKAAAKFDEVMSGSDTAQLVEYYDKYMPSTTSSSTLGDNLKKLGAVDSSSPTMINIYSATFEDKDRIADLIAEYNETADEDNKISYTDYVALLMSGITDIINAISYGLIMFVSVSLVVSSIMIGIITYISVLERTKEIGVLRSIGASKRDISRVFNAETMIVGLTAGLLGIGISLLLCIPISLIVHALTGITALNAFLEPIACVILVAISVVLTLIAGFIPSGMAAKLDPVEALRSE